MEENTNTLRKKAEDLYKQNKFEEIITLLTDEELETRNDAELYVWRARANYRLNYDIAITMLFAEKALAADPTYFMGYFARALVWEDKKENDKAITDYTKAIELNPDFTDAYFNRGVAWQNKKENDRANADFDKAFANYNKDIEIGPKYADVYNNRGYIWYNKNEYDNAIADYTKAIDINRGFADAYYNRGLAWVVNKKYNKAIEDYTKAIELKPDYKDAYYNERGLAWKAKGKYKEAIADYTEAIKINPVFENAYYNRGLVKKENNIDLKGSIKDFEKYLELTLDENEIWAKYARKYIKELKEKIEDPVLWSIRLIVKGIKDILLIKEKCVHYTSFATLKKLILEESIFRISEGNFMNDPTEGEVFFNFLNYKPYNSRKDDSSVKTFSPKPFIGSFVTEDKYNDLNMWRFYGKEEGVEAKGCAISLRTQEFIDDIKNILLNEKKEARLDNESDINFYRVVYEVHYDEPTHFYIPNSEKSEEALEILMKELKIKVESYNRDDTNSLEEYLNSVAFLFKSDAYENENEVRLVVEGIEFDKEYYEENKEDKSVNPPRVCIELGPIKKRVGQITLGPKVDKANEWASALHYSYKGEEKAPEIRISHLPYK